MANSLNNQDLIQYNELSKNSNGGTELTTRGIYNYLPRELLEKVQIITSRVRELEDKPRILHLHDLALDPESKQLADESYRNQFDKLVFVSEWQYQQYRDYLGIPWDSSKCQVIYNGIEPLEFRQIDPNRETIKLIYTSTPHRGLEILVPVFIKLCEYFNNLELHVYSSFEIYGWKERDEQYKQLFELCKSHEKIHYHGFQPQDILRTALTDADIFVLPSIWQETFCRCVVEAMSAGCEVVHSNLGALPEVTMGLSTMYNGTYNMQEHSHTLFQQLAYMISTWDSRDFSSMYNIKTNIDTRFGWDSIKEHWFRLLVDI